MARTKTPTAPVRQTIAEQIHDEFADFPNVAVLERRLEHPGDPGSAPIYLLGETQPSCGEIQHFAKSKGKDVCVVCRVPFRRWYIRSINAGMPNRLHAVTYTKGYVKVLRSELADPDQISDLQAGLDEVARRGDGGKIVLAKIPFKAYAAIKLRELELRQSRERNAKKQQAELADAAGQALGDEAGDSISKMQATFSRTASTIQDELADRE